MVKHRHHCCASAHGAKPLYVEGDTILLIIVRFERGRKRMFFAHREDAERYARELERHFGGGSIIRFPEGSAARDVIVYERVRCVWEGKGFPRPWTCDCGCTA